MPIVSALGNTPYEEDDLFRPVTTYSEPNVPNYSVGFHLTKSYTGTDFAFDRCEDRDDLLSGDLVDPNFLICRYERLFLIKGRPNFYLVPWMGVPGAKSGGTWTFDKKNFALSVRRSQITPEFPVSGNTVRSLKLVASGGIQATWASQANAAPSQRDTLQNVDIMGVGFHDTVDILIPNGQYNPAGEQIEILDTADNKTVGKLRIIFLEKRKIEFFLIRITDEFDRFKFKRVANADIPTSLESAGASTSYTHRKITDDARDFGFKQIGVELSPAPDSLEIYDSVDVRMPLETTSATPPEISKSDAGLPNGTTLNLTLKQYEVLFDLFLLGINYLQAGAVKRSKYSAVFVFLTPFCVKNDKEKNVVGVQFPHQYQHTTGTKDTVKSAITLPHNASLFETRKCMPALTERRRPEWVLAGRFHEYQTFVHEFAHALFVNHYFETDEDAIATNSNIVNAHRMLRLYLQNDYVREMDSLFDDKKLSINDFKTGTVTNQPFYTYFDQINAEGIDQAIEALINKAFPGGPGSRPGFWTSPATHEMTLGDLAIWVALNDLVKFNEVNSTMNVLDYDTPTFDRNPTAVQGKNPPEFEAFIVQTAVRFSRFQWEVLRKAIDRMNNLTI